MEPFWNKVVSMAVLIFFLLFGVMAPGISGESKMADHPLEKIKSTGERLRRGKAIYAYYCSTCHGVKGDGRGPNAENLSTRPRNFTDKLYMDTKSDRDLYQAINGGGSGVGLSFLMPPWGDTLSKPGRSDVIVYIRTFEKSE